MIDELRARDVALIREAAIEPARGLTVLTGETGAGKTALLSSIKLLVGERADAGMVREGAPSLEVEGRLFLPGDDEDGTVVRRRVGADGRGRVELDGHLASVRELAERVGATVDLCGQHEHQRLLSVQAHVELLDAWAGAPAADALALYRDALAAAEQARVELERVREVGRATGERLDEATFVLRRIDEVDPREGEFEELEAQLPRVEHGEALMAAAAGARERLSGEGGACDALGEAARALREAARYDERLSGWAQTLESSLIDVEDVSSELRAYADEVDFDPEELDRLQERLAALEGLRRAYGPRMADVLRRREEAREVVEAASDGGELERRAAEEVRRRERALAVA
ncbi:AAA family ATPase, partial [Thermophilibacter sp.]|uniref:AAA family ATPase n=1 Tax=Thermophilibacter sp. TaxID=2847309 RepID=UPI003A91970B